MIIGVNLSQTISELLSRRYSEEVSDSIQRLTSGLRINDAADDVGGLVLSNRLKNSTSSLLQGIENGNRGLALVQFTNKALDNQTDILSEIKTKLELARLDSTSSDGREAIRSDIVDLLTQFNQIASDTNYNNIYTLQKSNTDTDFSLTATFTFDANSSTSVTTESLKSNTEGLGLDILKNLNPSELTSSVAVEQIDVVAASIETVEDFKNSFKLTQGEIESVVTNLTGIEKTTKASKDDILNADSNEEMAILDKYKLLEQSSEFAFVQANITQSVVLKLLSTSLNIKPLDNTETKKDIDYNSSDNKTSEPFGLASNYSYTPPKNSDYASGNNISSASSVDTDF